LGPSQPGRPAVCGAGAFPGKVDTGFPNGNATNIEARALPGHDRSDFQVNVTRKRSSRRPGLQFAELRAERLLRTDCTNSYDSPGTDLDGIRWPSSGRATQPKNKT